MSLKEIKEYVEELKYNNCEELTMNEVDDIYDCILDFIDKQTDWEKVINTRIETYNRLLNHAIPIKERERLNAGLNELKQLKEIES